MVGYWAPWVCQGIQIPSYVSVSCEQRSCNLPYPGLVQTLYHDDKHYGKVSYALPIRICMVVTALAVHTYGIIHCTLSHWLLDQSISHVLSTLAEFVGSKEWYSAWCAKGCLCFIINISQNMSQVFPNLIN